jgi:pilus assembly protein CpaB
MRGVILIIAALLVGGLAVFLARDWIESQIPEPVVVTKDKVPLTTVVVARRDLFFGDRLRPSFIEERPWPKGNLPEGSFTKAADVMAGDPVVIRQISKNEPILRTKLTGEGGRASLSAKVTQTMRAVSLRISDILGVAGYVLPGDRVDILLTRDVAGSPITDILLQNVRILGIDQNANEETDGVQPGRTATIEVTPEQAQKIVLASRIGSLSFTLRNYIDVDATRYRTVTLADLNVGEINQSPNTGEGESTGAIAVTTPVDPRTKVTITRGLFSKDYRVQPAAPRRSRGIDLRSVGNRALPGQVVPPPPGASTIDRLTGGRPAPSGISSSGLSAVPPQSN